MDEQMKLGIEGRGFREQFGNQFAGRGFVCTISGAQRWHAQVE
jgi:hypothetical protein